MELKELSLFLNRMESKYPVGSWYYGDIHIWPAIKIKLALYIHSNFINQKVKVKKEKEVFQEKIFGFFKSIIGIIKILFFKPSHGKYIFVTENNTYRSEFHGKEINRFYYPFHEQLEKEKIYPVYLNWSKNKNQKTLNKNEDCFYTVYIEHLYTFLKITKLYNLKIGRRKQKLNGLNDFLEEVNSMIYNEFKSDFKFSFNFLINYIESINVFRKIANLLIRKFNPELALELCYYSEFNMALNIEGKKSGFETIELQHGGFGDTHTSYYGWEKFPSEGYEIFPQKIWVWDNTVLDYIDSWVDKQKGMSTFTGGNPWIQFIVKEYEKSYNFNTEKTIILYTLQESAIEDYIWQAIEKSPNYYQWWIRPHPGKPETKDILNKKIKELGIKEKIEIEMAEKLPLPYIMKHTSIHMSGYSGSIIEAAILGVQTIILDSIGIQDYSDLIQKNKAVPYIKKESEGLLEIINRISAVNHGAEIVDSQLVFSKKVLKILN